MAGAPFGLHVAVRSAARRDAALAPPQAYFVVSAVFHYLGPAFAVLLFARVDVLGVAWLRIASAALIFAAWRRPWRAFERSTADGRRLLLAWGARAGGDELLLLPGDRPAAARHRRGDRVPAGDRARGARARGRRATLAALALAVPGVYLLTDVRLAGEPLGVALRVRQRRAVRALHRARPPRRRSAARSRGDRRPGCVDADRRGRRHADRRLGGGCRRSATRSRCSPASASGSARR